MTLTKEQLIAENAKLSEKIGRLVTDTLAERESADGYDRTRRQELSLALGSGYDSKNSYGFSNHEKGEPIVWSWAKIHVELGKVLAAKNYMDFKGNISELEYAVETIKNDLHADHGSSI